MDDGIERIESPDELAAVRRQAHGVLFKSVVASGAVMAVLLLLAA